MAWIGGLALLIFAFSGLMHPLMSWTTPMPAAFFPPQTQISASDVKSVGYILKENKIKQAQMVKIVPLNDNAVLQVTENQTLPRRYFDLNTYQELSDYDKKYALWLGRYYTGFADIAVKNVTFQTEFSDDYPWVNRLLPVYKIEFDTPDNRTVFIHTELSSMTGMTNNYKNILQSVFQTLHTWDWVTGAGGNIRIILMMTLLISLTVMGISGTLLTFVMQKRKIADAKRRFHRRFAYFIFIPVIALSISGIYHLLQMNYGDNIRGFKINPAFLIKQEQLNAKIDFETQKFNGLNMVSYNGDILYRLSVPAGHGDDSVSRTQKYAGVVTDKNSIFIDAKTGKISDINDMDMVKYYAQKHLNITDSDIKNINIITNFSTDYDFRNKRLPAYQVNMVSRDIAFIDPATGALIDSVKTTAQYEGFIFAHLHKGNFMVPFLGRFGRDVLIVIILIMSIISTILGYKMLIKKKKG